MADDVNSEVQRIPLETVAQATRCGAGCVLAALVGFAAFGLVLALLMLPDFSVRPAYELATVLVATGIGFVVGGYIAGWIAGRRRALCGGIFGFAFGLFAFGYVLGPRWSVLVAGLASAALGWLGGSTARRWRLPDLPRPRTEE
jgi:MFS family permease